MNDQVIEQEIVAKGLTAPRVTPDLINALMTQLSFSTHVFPGTTTTIALAQIEGFTVGVGQSACVSAANFNAELGAKIAIDNAKGLAREKLWELEGYVLKRTLANQQPAPGAAFPGYNAMPPHQQRVVDEKAELDGRLAKLEAFFDTPIFAGLDPAEQQRLHDQAVAMHEYANILADRVEAFVPVALSAAT